MATLLPTCDYHLQQVGHLPHSWLAKNPNSEASELNTKVLEHEDEFADIEHPSDGSQVGSSQWRDLSDPNVPLLPRVTAPPSVWTATSPA